MGKPIERLDLLVKYLYFYKTMNDSPPHGSLATRLAALQQQLLLIEGGIAPYASLTPSAGSSRHQALRTNEGPEQIVSAPKGNTKIVNSGQLAKGGQGPTRAAAGFGAKGPISARSAKPTLIGASKSQPPELLEEAISLGLRDFGENKVQEAQGKWPALLARHPQVRLHLIGPLQSNKAADAVALFDVIHSVDRIKIADALADACEKTGKRPALLVQVNTGEEPQKAGAAPRDVGALLAHCRTLGLNVTGLMCVPPDGINPAPHFALLKKMADELALPELSMGMSSDYETALRLGATMIRVGTALFGSRH
jgi:PLP dependent protein